VLCLWSRAFSSLFNFVAHLSFFSAFGNFGMGRHFFYLLDLCVCVCVCVFLLTFSFWWKGITYFLILIPKPTNKHELETIEG
jgi:hypothetical protein